MPFDIDLTLNHMLDAVKTCVGKNWDAVKNIVSENMQNRKQRLQMLADMRINGEIDEDGLLSRLDDEKRLMDSELHALSILTKAMAQQAANAAIDVFRKAILAVIKL